MGLPLSALRGLGPAQKRRGISGAYCYWSPEKSLSATSALNRVAETTPTRHRKHQTSTATGKVSYLLSSARGRKGGGCLGQLFVSCKDEIAVVGKPD